jgi:pimeloyl-ACP methyl ester carboxylesterase
MAGLSGRRVEAGGRGLHVVQGGCGAPAVVFEAGFGCDSGLWREVQERVAQVTATYSYDRADHGLSEDAGPWSLEAWVADLETWIGALAVPPPYVLAGHSFGGHIVRAFGARHPGEVTGMVLVDARHQRWREMLPDYFHARLRELAPFDTEQALNADEVIRGLCDAGVSGLDVSGLGGGGLGGGGLRVTVITHGQVDWIPAAFGFGPAEVERCEQAWQDMQRDLAAQFPGAAFRVAARSGHLIPAEEPELVAREILALIEKE